MPSKAESSLTHKELVEALEYDDESGLFWWASERSNKKIGDPAGCINGHTGYRQVTLNKMTFLCHRLAWFYVHGEWPVHTVDHINRDRKDNRLSNLRIAVWSQNQWNRGVPKTNTSGHKGVSWCRLRRKWHVGIKVKGKTINLGYYDELNEAASSYQHAAALHHKEFARVV